jgi:hypothetical protein
MSDQAQSTNWRSSAHWTPLRERVDRRLRLAAWKRHRFPRRRAPLVFLLRWNHEAVRRETAFRVDGRMTGRDVLYTADHMFKTAERMERGG